MPSAAIIIRLNTTWHPMQTRYMPPQGSVGIYGFATNTLYYNELLEMLKVKTHIFRVGTYKSAVEPMLRNDMSPEARESTQRFISVLWDNYLTSLAENRKTGKNTIFRAHSRCWL